MCWAGGGGPRCWECGGWQGGREGASTKHLLGASHRAPCFQNVFSGGASHTLSQEVAQALISSREAQGWGGSQLFPCLA